MKLNKKRTALLGIFVLLVAILVAVLLFMGRSSSKKEKIGFIMTGNIGEEGWNGMHYEGVAAACDTLDVELLVKENTTLQAEVDLQEVNEEEASGPLTTTGHLFPRSCRGA